MSLSMKAIGFECPLRMLSFTNFVPENPWGWGDPDPRVSVTLSVSAVSRDRPRERAPAAA